MIVLLFYVPLSSWHPDYSISAANCFHRIILHKPRQTSQQKNKYCNIGKIGKYWEDKAVMSGV